MGGDAAGALLRPAPLPRRRLRGQVRDGAAASGAADRGAAVGGRRPARAADGVPAAAVADRRDRTRPRRRPGPDRPRRRADRDLPAARRTTPAGSRPGSTAPAAMHGGGGRARGLHRARTPAALRATASRRARSASAPAGARSTPSTCMGSARMGGSSGASAASPTGETWDVREPRRRRRLRVPDRLGREPDDHDRGDRAPERAAPGGAAGLRHGADVEAGRGLLADRALVVAAEQHLELLRRGLRARGCTIAGAGREALVVEPVQQLAVVLGEPDDLGLAARSRGRRAAPAPCSRPARTPGRPASRAGSARGCRAASRSARPCRRENVSPSSSAWTCASAAV